MSQGEPNAPQAHTHGFEFNEWESWLETRTQVLLQAGKHVELRRGGEPTPKPCCSFRVKTDHALGQFDFWATGEADYDVMDSVTRVFIYNVWGLDLSDTSFEATFENFLELVIKHRGK